MTRTIPSFLLDTSTPVGNRNMARGKLKAVFIDRTLTRTASFVRNAIIQYEKPKTALHFASVSAQSLLIFFLIYIVCIGLIHSIIGQLVFTGLLFILVLIAPVKLHSIYRTAFFLSFLFGFMVMAPAVLNVFTPGKMLITLLRFPSDRVFLIYHIPAEIGITDEGIMIVLRMFIKVFNSLTLTFVILQSTSFNRLIKALRFMRVPSVFILIITLAYKFIFIMSQTIEEMYLAMRARWTGSRDQRETRRIVAGRMGFLFKKSWMRYEETYKAMTSRGFTGELTLSGRERITGRETIILIFLTGLSIAIIILTG